MSGLLIKAHAVVADAALFKARDWMKRELEDLPDAAYNMKMAGVEFHIIGKDQQTSDLPEHRALKGKPFDGDITMTGEKPTPGPEGLKKYDPEAYALLDDIYSGRIKVERVGAKKLKLFAATQDE